MQTPSLSIIIVSWNVKDLLRQCLRSLQQHLPTGETEVIVVDNASADGSSEMVRNDFPGVVLIANEANNGFARANNQAVQKAAGEYVIFLNPDTVLASDFTATVFRFFVSHPGTGILGGKIIGRNGKIQRSIRRDPSAGVLMLLLLKFQALFPRMKPLARYYALDFNYEQASTVEQVMGAFMVVRQEVLRQLNGFDEEYFLWFEEVDLCRRARRLGWTIAYEPSISITHYGGESFGQLLSHQQQRLFNRSLMTYTRKHHSHLAVLVIRALYLPSLLLSVLEPLARRFITPQSPQ